VRLETILIAAVWVAGCEEGAPPELASRADSGTRADAAPPETRYASTRANLRFKRADRLRLDFARALDLPPDELCQELGQIDCAGEIHKVTLGGVDAYATGIYSPFPETSVSAPMVVERIATAGCTRRITLDLEDPDASLIWGRIPVMEGRIDVEGDQATAALTTLFTRALLRTPSERELSGLRELYREIEAAELDGPPAFAWAQVACMAVLTSVESLFY